MIIISLNIKSQDSLFIGNDTSVCNFNGYIITGNLPDSIYQFEWNTGAVDSSILVNETGEYSLTAIMYDSIYINDTILIDSISGIDTFYVDSIFLVLDIIDTIAMYDTIFVELKNVPVPSFSSEPVCFGVENIINNLSTFEEGSSLDYYVDNQSVFSGNSGSFTYFITENQDTVNFYVEIHQPNGCTLIDSFSISNKLVPTSAFAIDSICENQNPLFDNNSLNTFSTTSIIIKNGNSFIQSFNNEQQIELSDTLADGPYKFDFIVDNNNGCADTSLLTIEILAVDYVSFSIEDSSGVLVGDLNYCIGDSPAMLLGSQNGGSFFGNNIIDNGNGSGLYELVDVVSNSQITYSYTNEHNCTDTYLLNINNVFPLPELNFTGLNSQYCVFDSSSIIQVNQSEGSFIPITTLSQLNSESYLFDPNEVGPFQLTFEYTDANGCYNEYSENTIVFALPILNLDSIEFINPGGSVTIGDPNPNPDVSFIWSNGKTTNTIEVSFPGAYVVYAENTTTGCMASDTVIVQLSTNTNDENFADFVLYPNPVIDDITVGFPIDYVGNLSIFDYSGRLVHQEKIIEPKTKYSFELFIDQGLYIMRLDNGNYFRFYKM